MPSLIIVDISMELKMYEINKVMIKPIKGIKRSPLAKRHLWIKINVHIDILIAESNVIKITGMVVKVYPSFTDIKLNNNNGIYVLPSFKMSGKKEKTI